MEVPYLMTHLPPPPWSQLMRTADREELRPYTRLAPPAAVASVVAYLKDMSAVGAWLQPGTRSSPPSAGSGGGGGDDPPARQSASAKAKVRAAAAAAKRAANSETKAKGGSSST